MLVQRSAAEIEVRAPAKLNLFFEVHGRRDDGFHEIESLMMPVSLYDTLVFEDLGARSSENVAGGGFAFSVRSTLPHTTVPTGADNLVCRAIELLRRETGIDRAARIHLIKRIPSEAGLGGGSSDAAAALVAGNLGWNLRLSAETLNHLAAELGSDVPFFLAGGTAICRGRGEQVERAQSLAAVYAVIVKPNTGLSTAKVYGACEAPQTPRPLPAHTLNARTVGRHLHNRLQPAAESLSPEISQLKKEFSLLDFCGHQLTGSGTAYFGICRSARHARRLGERLRGRGLGEIHVVRGTG